MNILYIIPYVPYPLNSGGNQAFFNMVDAVRKIHNVSLLLYAHSSKEKMNVNQLQEIWPNVSLYCYADFSPKKASMEVMPVSTMSWFNKVQCQIFEYFQHSMERKIARRKRKYSTKKVQQEFYLGKFVRENSVLFRQSPDLNDGFLSYVYETSRKGFDVIQVEFFEYLPLVYLLPKEAKTVFVHHELSYIRKTNEMQLFDEVKAIDRMLFEQQKATEMTLLSAFDHVIVLTETDKELLTKEIPSQNIYVSPALTSSGRIKEYKKFVPAQELVFVGSGDHFPNADGLLWFCQEVIPELKKLGAMPKVLVTGLWGDNIRKIIHTLAAEVEFVGFVDDLGAFLNGRISIIPIRIGSGMRMKILDAIAAASPLVTTSKGCEGYPLIDKIDYLIADTPVCFAGAINDLLCHTDLQENLTSSSAGKLNSLLNGEALIQRRLDFYKQVEHEK